MKLRDFMIESFQTISINGILYSLGNDERKIYSKCKENGKVMKIDLTEFDQRIASGMVSKGLLSRRKTKQGELYFTCKGRRKNICKEKITEVAPPSRESEDWINKNKERFKEKYGKEYEKYLYGKAWNKYNGKK